MRRRRPAQSSQTLPRVALALALGVAFFPHPARADKSDKSEKKSAREGKASKPDKGTARAPGEPKFKAGQIDPKQVPEGSGLVASRKYPGVFWTLGDSGNAPSLYAVTREGELLNAFPVAVKNDDWEDIAIDGDGHLFIADVGNNDRSRGQVAVYRVDEPDPRAPRAARGAPPLRVNGVWRLDYPGGQRFDAESLFVLNGKGYVISKLIDGGQASVYSFDLAPRPTPAVLQPVCVLPVRSPCTAADVSPDGGRLAVMTVTGPYVFQIDGDVANAAKVEPTYVTWVEPNIEAVCFVEGGLLASNERGNVYYFADRVFKGGK